MSDFTFEFTEEKLAACVPTNKNVSALFAALNAALTKYDITSPERVAAFLAQCGHESLDFNILKENLNYNAAGLLKVFPRFFPTQELADTYAHHPEMIANRVYGNRMGNGKEETGDGWKYHGRGAIQITGHNNYQLLATALQIEIDDAVAYCETLDGAIESACWYWTANGLNTFADAGDNVTMTKRINGGTIGLEDRNTRLARNLQALS